MTVESTDINRAGFAHRFAELARKLLDQSDPSTRDLGLFRERIMARPDDLRRRLLGANIQRRRTLSREARSALESLDVHPDLLSPIGELRYEPTHSRLIARFVNPRVEPVLALRLLRVLLDLAGVPAPSDDALATAVVVAERWFPSGDRVDVSIELPDHVVFVEMKVDAEEGHAQLARYAQALAAARGLRAGTLVYLTLAEEADVPTGSAAKRVTLKELLAGWLPHAGPGSGSEQYLARYLKSVALLVHCAGRERFDDWTMTQQRSALDLVGQIE